MAEKKNDRDHQIRAGLTIRRGEDSASEWDLPVWKKAFFALVTIALFFSLVEGGLALLGVRPRLDWEDPFVGFVSNIPLFIESVDATGQPIMVTAPNKRGNFNVQEFSRQKPAGTYRIFCLGGSTTYGRPYSDATSFSGCLRALLPVADPQRRWEVINAGGISYASYRVASLAETLLQYDPDLFIIYTGHNEFLEERTYGELRDLPGPLKTTLGRLAHTRIWTALNTVVEKIRSRPTAGQNPRSLLPSEVQAKLDHSAGLELYRRDDALREAVLAHFGFSLRRMVEMTRGAGANIILVKPAANLRDFSPFKSQPTEGMTEEERSRSRDLQSGARELMRVSEWEDALKNLEEGLAIDPRSANLHYLRGRALLALGRTVEAEAAFRQARDEDVCPLRALSSMEKTVAEVASEYGAPCVDFVSLVKEMTQARAGHSIAGEEFFLDHVHPTIEGHRRLAVALIEAMIEQGIVQPRPEWGEDAISQVAATVEASIDPDAHAQALANLALTLSWAGKQEDSQRLASQALESGSSNPTVLMMVGKHYALEGKKEEALKFFVKALKANPGNPEIHSQIGFLRAGWKEFEAAAAHFFLASLIWADNDTYHQQLGEIMAMRGRPDIALTSLQEARRLNPANPQIERRIDRVRAQMGEGNQPLPQPELATTRYPSGYPHTLAQTQMDPTGRRVPHGIWTEWFDGGGLEAFTDYEQGQPHGVSIRWDEEGRLQERSEYRQGRRMDPR